MAPAKAARSAQDDSKSDTPNTKEKNGAAATHHSNGKLRRVGSSTGTNLREATNSSAGPAAPTSAPSTSAPAAGQEASIPGVRSPNGLSLDFGAQWRPWLTLFTLTASMARIRARSPPWVPSCLSPQHPDRLRERRPPMGSHPVGKRGNILANNC